MSIFQYRQQDQILLAVDCIIFGFDGTNIKALLIKRDFEPGLNCWSLMGGFVRKDEGVDDAAKRVLHRLTGLKDIYMEQLGCFGEVDRDPGGRVISIAYFSLIKINGNSQQLMEEHNAEWITLSELPALIFDHSEMIERAKQRLREKIGNHPIGFELLPKRFTLQQLQSLYEAIYEITLDKRNFAKKILGLDILQKLEEKEKESSRKGAFYYVFNTVKYKQLEQEGVKFI